ncbi:hypothetical protein PIB30_067283 [Stylosanthes scabra]|uniref:Uncharacterized protein n=1 Tax=Stylosanthes scabra TaxID=79078 RepID=A0ABU6QN50_9FABA|nr:hypothetical protein [Stylosanthes scabra]
MIKENSDGLIIAEKALKERDALYEKHLLDANSTLKELSKYKYALVKKLAEIQAQIREIDEKMAKLKKPFEKIHDKKTEIEETQEIDLFKGFEENKLQLKDTLEAFLKELED